MQGRVPELAKACATTSMTDVALASDLLGAVSGSRWEDAAASGGVGGHAGGSSRPERLSCSSVLSLRGRLGAVHRELLT
jgi:hypothetical protein